MENWEETKLLIENCINKSFKENIPAILAECARQAKEVTQTCNAHNEFRRETDVDSYREMKQNYSKLRKKEMTIFGMITVVINGMITTYIIKKFF